MCSEPRDASVWSCAQAIRHAFHADADALDRGSHALLRDEPPRHATRQWGPSSHTSVGGASQQPCKWSLACAAVMPRTKLAMFVALCDEIALTGSKLQDGLNAEELLPLVSHSIAEAVAAGNAADLLCHLAIVHAYIDSSAAASKFGYCLTTVQVAARSIVERGYALAEDHMLQY